MGCPEKSDVCDVDAGQTLELEYATMEPSRQGKLSILSRQESSLFSLTFGMLYYFIFKGIFRSTDISLFLVKYGKIFLLQISKGLKQIVEKLLFSFSKLEKIKLY